MKSLGFLVLTAATLTLRAATVPVELVVAETTLTTASGPGRAIAFNGTVPGPVLRFREGDTALITVRNTLKAEETSVHWHGLLLPNAQDGVPYLTTPPIPAGGSYTYQFNLRHAGTYWYHSHSGLQEQQGLYGAIVVEPSAPVPDAPRDVVLVLSDWTAEPPSSISRRLKTGTEWYTLRKGNQTSWFGAWRAGALGDYLSAQWHRLPPMDVSDIAYDAFWINGRANAEIAANPGERLRLRVINAGASTYFHLNWSGGPMTAVSADGQDVEPLSLDRLFIGMGETYDLMVTAPAEGAAEFRATAQDGSGRASAWIGTNGPRREAASPPRPDPYRMDDMIARALDDDPAAALSPYPLLRATRDTAFDPALPRRTLPLRLTGNMERYVWSLNGRTIGEEMTIPVKRGEVLRLEMVNDTMMHHPMHLHGFFFRLENGQGARAPLKHTVDVPPMGRRTIEFAANEEGDWFFHCHLLYHMEAGMGRILRVGLENRMEMPDLGPGNMNPYHFTADAGLLSRMGWGRALWMDNRNDLSLEWDAGWAHRTEVEADALWARVLDRNTALLAGARITDGLPEPDRGVAGVRHRLPLLVGSRLTADTEGEARINLEKEVQLAPRLTLALDGEYDTGSGWAGGVTVANRLNARISLALRADSDHGVGAGLVLHH